MGETAGRHGYSPILRFPPLFFSLSKNLSPLGSHSLWVIEIMLKSENRSTTTKLTWEWRKKKCSYKWLGCIVGQTLEYLEVLLAQSQVQSWSTTSLAIKKSRSHSMRFYVAVAPDTILQSNLAKFGSYKI